MQYLPLKYINDLVYLILILTEPCKIKNLQLKDFWEKE